MNARRIIYFAVALLLYTRSTQKMLKRVGRLLHIGGGDRSRSKSRGRSQAPTPPDCPKTCHFSKERRKCRYGCDPNPNSKKRKWCEEYEDDAGHSFCSLTDDKPLRRSALEWVAKHGGKRVLDDGRTAPINIRAFRRTPSAPRRK